MCRWESGYKHVGPTLHQVVYPVWIWKGGAPPCVPFPMSAVFRKQYHQSRGRNINAFSSIGVYKPKIMLGQESVPVALHSLSFSMHSVNWCRVLCTRVQSAWFRPNSKEWLLLKGKQRMELELMRKARKGRGGIVCSKCVTWHLNWVKVCTMQISTRTHSKFTHDNSFYTDVTCI